MKRSIALAMMICIGITAFPQEKKMNQTVPDPESNRQIIVGYTSITNITDSLFNDSFRNEYDNYAPDQEIMAQVSTLLDQVSVTIVFGTWCSDSHEQVPRFIKIIDRLGNGIPSPTLIGVDRDKKAGEVSLEGMNILKVPTFIIFHNNRELGRIIETPESTLEKDLLAILKMKL